MWDVLMDDREPRAALFCTYGFDALFFESEVLPSLFPVSLSLARDAAPAGAYLNAADAALSRTTVGVFFDHLLTGPELVYGTWRVSVAPRAFHPKLMVIDYGDVIRVAIGSANLSRAAWSSLLELFVVEDLIPGEAHPWAAGVRRFAARLEERIPASQRAAFAELTAGLSAVPPTPGAGPVRSSWDGPLLDTLLEGLRNATRVDVVTPFLEGSDGTGVFDDLRERIGDAPGALYIGTDDSGGRPVVSGPPDKLRELIDGHPWKLHGVKKVWEGDEPEAPLRALHGKLVAVSYKSGSRVMTGSANCTRAALLHAAPHGNVELVVVEDYKPAELREMLPQATALDPNAIDIVDRGDPTGEDDDAPLGPASYVRSASYRVAEQLLELELDADTPPLTFAYDGRKLSGELAATRWTTHLDLGRTRFVTVSDEAAADEVPFVIVDPESLVPRGTAQVIGFEDFCDVLAGYRNLPVEEDRAPRDRGSPASANGDAILGARGAIPWRRYLAAVAGLGHELERERQTARGLRFVIENPTLTAGLLGRLDEAHASGRLTDADLAYALYELARELRRVLSLEMSADAADLLRSTEEMVTDRTRSLVADASDELRSQLAILEAVDRA